MSLIIARVTPEKGLLAVDTAASFGNGTTGEVSKLHYVAHAHTAFAVRGDLYLGAGVYGALATAALPVNFDVIRKEVRDILPAVARSAPGVSKASELVFMGWSEEQDSLKLFRVDWSPEHGVGEVKELKAILTPEEPFEGEKPMLSSAEDAKALAPRMVEWLHAQGAAGGGRLLMACMNPSACTIKEIATLS